MMANSMLFQPKTLIETLYECQKQKNVEPENSMFIYVRCQPISHADKIVKNLFLAFEVVSKATITRCDLSSRFFCIDATLLCQFESDMNQRV